MSKFIVQTASAQVPSSWKWRGTYRRVAVLEVENGVERASMISNHAKDVIRVVETWERLNMGKTPRSQYHRALAEAEALAAKLNSAPQENAEKK